jgi:hypothetical protein
MPVVRHGKFGLNFGLLQVQAEVSEDDRQCAWETYCEIVTRVSVSGKSTDRDCTNFTGEVLVESLDSLHTFFRELRGLMRRFPVGRLSGDRSHHLGVLINDVIVNVLRPFLEEWHADYRHWWATAADVTLPPFERQLAYPRYEEFTRSWRDLRLLMRELRDCLVEAYQLVDVHERASLV